MTTVVVLGDVHGNAGALRAALDRARSGPIDRLVLLGDLLTYGHDVQEVIDLVADAQARDGAILLVGNHDQMYFELAEGRRAYLDTLPSWIAESVLRTVDRLDLAAFLRLSWQPEYVVDDVLFGHANPFGAGDWTYLNGERERARAGEVLVARDLTAGVFGHTHRPRWSGEPARFDRPHASRTTVPLTVNAGSVGQPRDEAGSVLLRLELEPDRKTGSFERIDYDVNAHLAALAREQLSATTLQRLAAFFQAPRA